MDMFTRSTRKRLHRSHAMLAALAGLPLAISVGGCGAEGVGEETISTVQSALLNHPSSTASETVVTSAVVNSAGNHTLVITYNHEDPAFVTYNNNSRQVRPNASLMKFFFLSPEGDDGLSGTVRPPTGWSVLWGDPAITRNRANANRIYMTNIAIPANKFPASGIIEGSVTTSTPANFCGAYIGGACIARSADGGRTFTLAAGDCVRRTSTSCPNGTFYDGAAVETSPEGRVYAAYNDVFRNRTDVYMATSSTGSFARVTDPTVVSTLHPRIKFGPNGLYLIVQNGSSLMMTRYGGGSSRTGTWTTPITVATGLTRGDVVFSDRSVRQGPEYDLDIGLNETGGTDARVIYQVLDTAGRKHIRISRCTTGTTISCSQPGAWDTDNVASDAVSSGHHERHQKQRCLVLGRQLARPKKLPDRQPDRAVERDARPAERLEHLQHRPPGAGAAPLPRQPWLLG